jgi:hypothetical protein
VLLEPLGGVPFPGGPARAMARRASEWSRVLPAGKWALLSLAGKPARVLPNRPASAAGKPLAGSLVGFALLDAARRQMPKPMRVGEARHRQDVGAEAAAVAAVAAALGAPVRAADTAPPATLATLATCHVAIALALPRSVANTLTGLQCLFHGVASAAAAPATVQIAALVLSSAALAAAHAVHVSTIVVVGTGFLAAAGCPSALAVAGLGGLAELRVAVASAAASAAAAAAQSPATPATSIVGCPIAFVVSAVVGALCPQSQAATCVVRSCTRRGNHISLPLPQQQVAAGVLALGFAAELECTVAWQAAYSWVAADSLALPAAGQMAARAGQAAVVAALFGQQSGRSSHKGQGPGIDHTAAAEINCAATACNRPCARQPVPKT